MKELTIEQKAKRYDEAIKIAKSKIKNDKEHVLYEDDILSIFSELKESDDDERIRKELIEFFTIEHWDGDAPFSAESAKERVAWLEKQGEQKPEWTPMDEQRVENLLAIIEGHGYPGEVKWLNSLKDRVQSKQGEQKLVIVPKFREGDIIKHKDTNETFEVSKIEIYDADEIYYHLTNGGCICENSDNFERVKQNPAWNEEDESHIRYLIECLEHCKKGVSLTMTASTAQEYINRLKSIKLQNTWKPSNAQMKALKEACDEHWEPDGLDPLYTLYQDLKKLREE